MGLTITKALGRGLKSEKWVSPASGTKVAEKDRECTLAGRVRRSGVGSLIFLVCVPGWKAEERESSR